MGQLNAPEDELRLRAARARIADVAAPRPVPAELGEIRLHDDQRRTAARALEVIARDGGCLIADDVGRGKTFVALAVARHWRHPLAVVPASLRTMWAEALRRARAPGSLVSHEALSRGRLPPPGTEMDIIIVDESHRFRSPATRRYDALTGLSAHVPLLLLSATPLQNGVRDLAAQIALFLGERAWRLNDVTLAEHVVRGPGVAHAALPVVAPPRWAHVDVDEGDVLEAILALPAPPRPLDGGDGGALRTIALVRAWASSRAALLAMIRRRRQIAAALEQSATDGRRPTRLELRAWLGADGGVQLGFAPLLAEATLEWSDATAIVEAARAEQDALASLTRLLAARPDPDRARIDALRAIRAAHAEVPILAFSELASTVRVYADAMRTDEGVGLLTARDARIASGRLPRAALLARFAPCAQGASTPPERERVSLLLATDLLSEGVNLQDASVVVHLDLPWNPARLAQRVGRVCRPGGAAVVHGYLLAPPARADLLLDVESRLRRKLTHAERMIGRALPVVPAFGMRDSRAFTHRSPVGASGSAAEHGELMERLARWRDTAPSTFTPDESPAVGAVAARRRGWLAALDDGRLLASLDGGLPTTAAAVHVATLADGEACAVRGSDVECARGEIARWLEDERIAAECGLAEPATPLVITVERRIAAAIARAPRHTRAEVVALASRLRAALRIPRSLGAERALLAPLATADGSAASAYDDRDWLASAVEIATAGPARRGASSRPAGVVGLILLVGRDAVG